MINTAILPLNVNKLAFSAALTPEEELDRLNEIYDNAEAEAKRENIDIESESGSQWFANYAYPQLVKRKFSTEESAIRYGKEQAVSALNVQNPYEHGCLFDNDGNLLQEVKGNEGSVPFYAINHFLKKDKEYTVTHGHPKRKDGYTNPVSFIDYKFLANTSQNVKKVIAYDVQGNFSSLEKLDKSKKTSKFIFKIEDDFFKEVFDDVDGKLVKNYYSGDSKKVLELIKDKTKDADYPKKAHKFWRNHAKEANIKYETNFDFLA